MKKLLTLTALSLAFCSPKLLALTLHLTGGGGYGPWQTGVGGEFTFASDNTSILSDYQGIAKDQAGSGTFQTYCVEGGENIYANGTYTANINNHSVYSNVQLTKGAAYLYSQFASGGNFNGLASYASSGTARHDSADLFQRAIWLLMGGQENLTQGNIGANAFIDAAVAAFGSFDAANSAAVTGYDGVYVLNLWDSATGRAAQDQLLYSTTINPNTIAPDGGTTVMLLGMGLTAIGFISRKVRK